LRAHHLGRVFTAQGYEVRLMAPEYVAPYVKAQKNDDRDAEAIAEAATRPTMRFVALKSEAQLDQQTLHRARSRLVNSRTRLTNQLRAILLERGITVAKGRRALAALDREFVETARTVAPARRLATIPGIGALNATALNAAVGEAEDFASARDLAAWLGLVPRQTTTGGRARLGGITKRGNVYLRTLLIHGACAALPGLSRGETPLGGGVWGRGEGARPPPRPPERGRGGAGGEARADRLGGAARRRRLCRRGVQVLSPVLHPGDIAIISNLSSHKRASVRGDQRLEAHGSPSTPALTSTSSRWRS
jgi:transposase